MTQARELKPCPFCGASLRYAEPVAYVHPVGKCILSGRNFHKGVIGQWNRRASAAPSDDALRVAAKAIVDHELFHDREYLSAELNEKLDALRAALEDQE